MTQFARKAAADYAESVVVAVTKAVERGMVVTLTTELDDLQKQFVERFTGSKIGQEQVAKSDEQQMVWGWASVSTLDGQLITDAQGDECDVIELQKAAHEFMQSSRVGKVMHAGRRKGYIADSIVFTKALQDALGIDLGMEGWFVGYKVEDPDTWARVKKGELRAFSIGGLGNREPLSKFNPHHDAKGRFGSAGSSGGTGGGGGGAKPAKEKAPKSKAAQAKEKYQQQVREYQAVVDSPAVRALAQRANRAYNRAENVRQVMLTRRKNLGADHPKTKRAEALHAKASKLYTIAHGKHQAALPNEPEAPRRSSPRRDPGYGAAVGGWD